MKLDGKDIARRILTNLTDDVNNLKSSGIIPTLSAVLVGDDTSSLSFIRQKQKAAEFMGAAVDLHQLPADAPAEALQTLLATLNTNRSVHGIIVQRPLPKIANIPPELLLGVVPQKDVDGFLQNSPYEVPVAQAVGLLLRYAKFQTLSGDPTANE